MVRGILAYHDAVALLVRAQPQLRWMTGFTGSNGLAILTTDSAHFITDGRYTGQARSEVKDFELHVPGYDLIGYVATSELLPSNGSVLLMAESTTLAEMEALRSAFPDREWMPQENLLTATMASKEEHEVEAVRRAQKLTCEVFNAILPSVRPGVSEREIAAEIVYQHLRRGASAMSFEPIVAAGPNSALPHGRPTDRRLAVGDVVLLDMGAYVEGYSSDLSRTVVLGAASDEFRTAYSAVLEAQEAALETVRAGASGKAVDAVARAVLDRAGYGAYFSHGLGHGVGLDVHEWPRLSYNVDHVLPENATVTVEPGIYLAERFGIRIEDVVCARADGCENLTTATKELLVLG
ncbi:aminopeptidase P family protein [soil metagenome]